ncbi:MAG: EthD domain-containing protein [Dehalococcoidales bacterium]|nr:EthD domain-containing protein [Dehalococcoidales bacterium]
MIKSIVVAHRKAGMTREEFSRYWLEEHAPLAARLMPGVRRYVQNHIIAVPGMEFEGDGIVETWYDDVEAWQKSMEAIRASKELAEDGAKFCDLRNARMWLVEEHVIK